MRRARAAVIGEALVAVAHVLDRVVGRVADERLRVDHQPRLALGREDVAAVQRVLRPARTLKLRLTLGGRTPRTSAGYR